MKTKYFLILALPLVLLSACDRTDARRDRQSTTTTQDSADRNVRTRDRTTTTNPDGTTRTDTTRTTETTRR